MKVCNSKVRRSKLISSERYPVTCAKGPKNNQALKAVCATLAKAWALKKIHCSTKRANATPAKATVSSSKANANVAQVEVFSKANNK